MHYPALLFGLFAGLLAAKTGAQQFTDTQRLGNELFSDINLSLNRNQSCESCHSLSRARVPVQRHEGRFEMTQAPSAGLVDLSNVQDGTPVSNGSQPRAVGGLNAPSATYAALTPAFHWNGSRFIGGQFWNGRARDLVEQAKGPFTNPLEMAMPNRWSVIERLRERPLYLREFQEVFGIDLESLEPNTSEAAEAFDAMASAIAAFERSRIFNRFTSKFDFVAAGITSFTASEQRGEGLFNGAALCSQCHKTRGISGEGTPAALSDFRYDNVGMPTNPLIPINQGADPGLAGNPNLESARGEPTPLEEVEGFHKTVGLRNVELTPPYMHNGVLKTLEEVVHYYNTRDVLPECVEPADAMNPGFGVNCWSRGEYHETQNVEQMGNLGLSEQDEADIVAFMKTFTDNYPSWGNSHGRSDPNVPRGTPSPFADFVVPDNSLRDTPGDSTPGQLTIGASKDASIFADTPEGSISNGRLFIGRNRTGSVRRGLIAFDLSEIPTGSIVDSVELTMTVSDSHDSGFTISMHRMQADWGEGTTVGTGGGRGRAQPATPNEVTWLHRFFDTEFWSSPGGDFFATPSAVSSAAVTTRWTGAGLQADVQDWVDNPGSNFGWILIGNEMRLQSVQVYFGSESFSGAPSLIVRYTPPEQ